MTREVKLSIPSLGLLAASAILAAAKIWGGLPWSWTIVMLPLWIAVGLAGLALVAFLAIGLLFIAALIWGR